MRILHLLKSEPDELTKTLVEAFRANEKGNEATLIPLYGEHPDYDHIIDQIFDHDRVITWW
jgi:hypothetical protein